MCVALSHPDRNSIVDPLVWLFFVGTDFASSTPLYIFYYLSQKDRFCITFFLVRKLFHYIKDDQIFFSDIILIFLIIFFYYTKGMKTGHS